MSVLDIMSKGFVPDVARVNSIVLCLVVSFAVLMILYASSIIFVEFCYFLFCRVTRQKFDYRVVLEVLTDYERSKEC